MMAIKIVISILLINIWFPLLIEAQMEIGTKAPELTLEGIYNDKNNKIPTLESLKGKIVVLDFWAIWCSPCVAAFPENNELSRQYKDRNVQFIAITDDPAEKLENFLKRVEIDFWVGRDDDKVDFINYGVRGRPQMYIINRDGVIVFQGHHVTKELIEEVIATNAVSPSLKTEQSQVIINGGFGPGEDPLYNGVNIMLNKDPDDRPVLIDHFIIRPSLDSSFSGYGIMGPVNGYFGVTYSGGSLSGIFVFLNRLSSSVWIKNNTKDTTLYDIVYWKKAENMTTVLNEIQQRLLEGLLLKYDSLEIEKEVNILSVNVRNENIKKADEIMEGAFKAYTPIDVYVSQLENKSQQLYIIDHSLRNTFINNQGMEWKKMAAASTEELLGFLNEKGITVTSENRIITLYEINK
jgi:thiol-disulfide isomerase/thioredoxin